MFFGFGIEQALHISESRTVNNSCPKVQGTISINGHEFTRNVHLWKFQMIIIIKYARRNVVSDCIVSGIFEKTNFYMFTFNGEFV